MWWFIHSLGLIACWHFSDLKSQDAIYSVFFPLMVAFFLIALFIKLVMLLGPSNGRSSHSSGDHGGGFWGGFGGSGGDGGCGGDGGGGC